MSDEKKPRVLFFCIGNMIRSQMAEGFAREYGGSFLEIYSAGLSPTGVVSEEAMEVMQEKGIDISDHTSNGFNAVPLAEMDYVISLTREPAASVVPSNFEGTVLDWPTRDPLGGSFSSFREVRDEIGGRVKEFVEGLWKSS